MKLKTCWIIALFTLFTAAFTVPLHAQPAEVPRIIFCGTADATSNLAAETSIMPTGVGTNMIRANYWKAGSILHIKAGGAYCTGSSGTLVAKVKLGENVIITSPTITPAGTSLTNAIWRLEADLICRSVSGNVGTFVANGYFNMYPNTANQNTNALANFANRVVTGMATNPSPITLYVNTNLTVGLTATWSATGIASGMSNVISTHDLTLLHTR